jgi:hypothetical protein
MFFIIAASTLRIALNNSTYGISGAIFAKMVRFGATTYGKDHRILKAGPKYGTFRNGCG